jgi:hypothetical protein
MSEIIIQLSSKISFVSDTEITVEGRKEEGRKGREKEVGREGGRKTKIKI